MYNSPLLDGGWTGWDDLAAPARLREGSLPLRRRQARRESELEKYQCKNACFTNPCFILTGSKTDPRGKKSRAGSEDKPRILIAIQSSNFKYSGLKQCCGTCSDV